MSKGWRKSFQSVKIAQQDDVSDAVKVIPFEHDKVHDRELFSIDDVQNIDTTTVKWLITTANSNKLAHMIFNAECTGEMSILVTEGADRNGSNALDIINHYRDMPSQNPTSVVTMHRGIAAGSTDGATTILNKRVGATGVASKTVSAGGTRAANEFILKRNTKYVVAITTYADVWVTFEPVWYENEPTIEPE